MLLRSPPSLHYPITVTELLKQPNDNVERFAPLFSYYYKTTVTEGNRFGDEYQIEKTYPSKFLSDHLGVLREWKVSKGTVISHKDFDIAVIDEPCAHEVQFGGMCANCGKDMTELTFNTEVSNTDRATINMTHDNVALTISQDEATRIDEEAKRRLLSSRKLILVVDLDQTIIHATVDPTVAEWQHDESNPNHLAVKDVRAFQLIDEGPGAKGCWYYIKLRPGLMEFLSNVSKIYELHIYTMGTRAYAQNIANIIDPDRKIFGDRILSRDESGSLTAKNLQRLFPVDTKMVVIIDDRGDVWKWTDNLLKVTPYDFFVGIGDINSSFLPKKQEIPSSPRASFATVPALDTVPAEDSAAGEPLAKEITPVEKTTTPDEQTTEGRPTTTTNTMSALEQLVSMGGGDDPTVMQAQATRQDEALAAQLQDRPLLQKQKQLDAEDDGEKDQDRNGDEQAMGSQGRRHNLLQDHDVELQHVERNLSVVHRSFFSEYDRRLSGAQSGRIAELRGEKYARAAPGNIESVDLRIVPDVKYIMPQMKEEVFGGLVLVFSGVVPIGVDIQNSDIALWAKTFGAQISEKIGKRTTHVIAARNRTAKVRQAARHPHIKIVTPQWLFDSISQWKRQNEEPYSIPIHPDDRAQPMASQESIAAGKDGSSLDSIVDDSALLSSSEEDEGDSEDESGAIGPWTEEVDDPEGLLPPEPADQQSPIVGTDEDWKSMQDALAEFLGSDAEDSDSDSVVSSVSNHSQRKRKRSPSPGETNEDNLGGDESVDSPGESHLSQRKRRAYERSTGLREVATATTTSSTVSSPTETREGQGGDGSNDEIIDHVDPEDEDSALEADLEAEFQAEMEAEIEAEMAKAEAGEQDAGD
ncbi:MAG: hypothetical protein M1819_006912 [Sarea resinae]|nr:MAG: hypothetical protein M1819_006912 [Sarea resinae]